jgi:hypothetical protein
MKTIAVFRVDKEDNVFALFPEELAGDPDLCSCYQHIGQHCAAYYYGCIRQSRPAKPEEYADLAEELRRIGYNLDIRKRVGYKIHEARRLAEKRFNAGTKCLGKDLAKVRKSKVG